MPLKTILRIFGVKKQQDKTKGAKSKQKNDGATAAETSRESREKATRQPRIHPYDEVSDAILEEKRAKRPPRHHDYDEVDLQRTMSKVNKTTKSAEEGGNSSSGD